MAPCSVKLESGAPGHIACVQGIQLLEVPATLDRSKGDIHAAGNPHYMTDPANARIAAKHIADAFSELDPKSKDPMIGTQDPNESIFVIPQPNGAPPIKISGFSSFVKTKAAAYCFLPSITALKFISKI